MVQLVKVKVLDLTAGPALDWVVAKAVGTTVELNMEFASKTDGSQSSGLVCLVPGARGPFKPSTDWAQGGPLIEQFDIWIKSSASGIQVAAVGGPLYCGCGSTKLEAACKAFVAYRLGEIVEVPSELFPVGEGHK